MKCRFLVLIRIGLIAIFFLAGCGPNIPGISSPLAVENGTIQVLSVERAEKLSLPSGSEARPPAGFEFVLVAVRTTGEPGSSFSLIDESGTRYQCAGLIDEKQVCYVPPGAKGVALWYSESIQIPLDGMLEVVPLSTATRDD